jgi:hypothetical protein
MDQEALAKEAGRLMTQMIKSRVRAGIGSDGQPLGTPMIKTGQMLDSVGVRRTRIKDAKASVEVGPSNAKHEGSRGKMFMRARNKGRGYRKFSNYALGAVLAYGVLKKDADGQSTGGKYRIPPRHWIHLTGPQRADLLRQLTRRSWMRARPGPP